MEKILFTSDQHTGHRAGLTPPKYQSGGRKWVRRQAQKWEWYESVINNYGPFSCHINLGDVVDGLGVKDSSETIIATNDQISAAVETVERIESPVNWFLYGTRVHTTTKDGYEIDKEVAKQINTPENPMIHGQLWLQFKEWIFDIRHAPASKSFVPTSRANPIIRERISNLGWHEKGVQPKATHYFRGHVHYSYSAGEPNTWQGYLLPALQSPATKYGRILSNIVDCGMCVMTIDKGWPTWEVIEAPKEQEEVFSLFNPQNVN